MTISPFFCRYHTMTDYDFLHKDQTGGGRTLPCCGGALPSAPPLQQFHIPPITQLELSSLMSLKAWGEKQKVCHDIAYLLVLAEEEATRNRRYGLSTIWVNPFQARVCFIEEAVRELTTWVSSGPHWPFALVQLNEDTCHVPLPKEGHLGILPQGGADMAACRRISQLEVHQLLTSGLQVAYPVGLNGHKDPIITSLPKSMANGISLTGASLCNWRSTSHNPWQKSWTRRHHPWQMLSYHYIQLPQDHSPKARKRGQHDHGGKESSVTGDIRHACSWVRELSPKRPNPVVILTPPPYKPKELPKPVDTSSQVSTQDGIKMAEASLGEVLTIISPIAMAPRSRSITLPEDMSQLHEKANKVLGELLVTKSSIDTHRQKGVRNWVWIFIGTTPRQQSPLKKLNPSVPMMSGRLKLSPLWPSGKLKPSALCPSGKLKPEWPPRLSHSTGNMLRSSNTWRSKSSKGKARVRLTFSLIVKLP